MNRWSQLGSVILILGALGHFLIVDVSVWILEASYVRWLPDSLMSTMNSTIIDWGILGRNNLLYIFAGFSLWLVISLPFLAAYNIIIFRELPPGHKLRHYSSVLSLSLSAIFLVVASVCYIYPAALGGALATIFFAFGVRKEMLLRNLSRQSEQ
ncbi:MAG: hypothetical protein HY562_00270 [Ignavibacteriales bacterium]|nr:hypothetical protein [Ignavibacteriales bacterium]